MYTLENYATAKAKLESANQLRENYNGNNPNKYQAETASARADLHAIEEYLKQTGFIPRTEIEERDFHIDKAFPNAQTKQIVEWQGKKYTRRFSPISTSLSGKTVNAWKKSWEENEE
nr:hypothetical protein [uncultured Albidiferax sp.]